ncbi:MAG TPA: hypothetical protein VFZ65_17915 [Planctomycetota bacterium]|nr:hypothetical protein [Planctomycetota bacterium]
MAASTIKQGTARELQRLFAILINSIGETLGSLIGREIVVRPGEAQVSDVESLLASLPRPYAIARGALDKGFAGKNLCALFEIQDAIAMAGLLMMTPDDIIAERRKADTMGSEDDEAFGELGNVLFSGFGNVLRDAVGNIDVRMHDRGVVQPGNDEKGMLGSEPVIVFGFRMKIGEYPESIGQLVVDRSTAEAWNKAPIEPVVDDGSGGARPATQFRADEDGLEGIPAAPIRGVLASFVMQPEVLRPLRRSCRRVGLELRRHGRGEIPNPAAHRNEIVLLDVPPGEDRRFDWCRRIKELSNTTKVVLLIHHPSRQRVTQAFLSRADAILGFPCQEMELSQKLNSMLADPPAEEPPKA